MSEAETEGNRLVNLFAVKFMDLQVAWPETGCVARNTQKMKESC